MSKTIYTTLLLLIAIIGISIPAQAQMCQSAGNVELTPSQTEGWTNSLTYTFTNYNSYQVTVKAAFDIVSTEGDSKNQNRTIVIGANESKSVKFTSNLLGGKNISCSDCYVSFRVEKCD